MLLNFVIKNRSSISKLPSEGEIREQEGGQREQAGGKEYTLMKKKKN